MAMKYADELPKRALGGAPLAKCQRRVWVLWICLGEMRLYLYYEFMDDRHDHSALYPRIPRMIS